MFLPLPAVQLCFALGQVTLQPRHGSLSVTGGEVVQKGLYQQKPPEQQTGWDQVKDFFQEVTDALISSYFPKNREGLPSVWT